ncbi:MAG: phage tail assembly protein [Prevotella sp.]|nr:phage tail assembly protein [Prevotella sp.]
MDEKLLQMEKASNEAKEAEKKSVETATKTENVSPYEVKFTRPYVFEGKTYNSINLEGLETLTSKDMREAESWLTKKGIVSAAPEMSMEYACFIASRATDLPIEFFERLHPKNAIKVKNRVTNFFYGED